MINKLYLIIIFFFVSCSEIDENEVESITEETIDWTSIDLTNDFIIGNFDELGINKTKLQAELDNISDFFRSDLYSLGVLYKGKLIIENYYSGNADSKRPIWSITKSILSLAIGKAHCDGKLDIQDKAYIYSKLLSDTSWGNSTIEQLLMMSSGANKVSLRFMGHKDEKMRKNAADIIWKKNNLSNKEGTERYLVLANKW